MTSLWAKTLHIQISISVVIRKDGAHKRYKKNISEDRATPKLGDAAGLTESSYSVCAGLSNQSGMDSSLLGNHPVCSGLSVWRGMGSTAPYDVRRVVRVSACNVWAAPVPCRVVPCPVRAACNFYHVLGYGL